MPLEPETKSISRAHPYARDGNNDRGKRVGGKLLGFVDGFGVLLLLLLLLGGGGRGGLGLGGEVAGEERRPEGGVKREASEAAGGDGEAAEVAEPQRGRRGAQLQDARPKLVRKIRSRHVPHPLGLGGERWSANTATARRLGERGGTEESYAVAQAPPPLPLSWTCEFRIPRRTRGIRNTQKEREAELVPATGPAYERSV